MHFAVALTFDVADVLHGGIINLVAVGNVVARPGVGFFALGQNLLQGAGDSVKGFVHGFQNVRKGAEQLQLTQAAIEIEYLDV